MHDETFFITKGRIRFTTDKGDVDTKAGDYVIVPTRSIHTFSNPFEEEAEFFNTFTPAYYVDYLRMLAKVRLFLRGLSTEIWGEIEQS
jgi:mannose-6-phosphate isomerase-like protein (cupin superfamily)